MPDSGWVKAVKEAGLPVFAVLLLACLALSTVWRLTGLAQPFSGALVWADTGAVVFAVVVLVHLLAYAWKAPKRLPEYLRVQLMAQRYPGLSDRQKQFLRAAFQRGSRSMSLHGTSQRWFEQLEELGYAETLPSMIIIAGAPTSVAVTVAAWKALERLARNGKL